MSIAAEDGSLSFDPPGVACRTLQECVLRQIGAREKCDPALAYRNVRDHWDLYLKRHFQAATSRAVRQQG